MFRGIFAALLLAISIGLYDSSPTQSGEANLWVSCFLGR